MINGYRLKQYLLPTTVDKFRQHFLGLARCTKPSLRAKACFQPMFADFLLLVKVCSESRVRLKINAQSVMESDTVYAELTESKW